MAITISPQILARIDAAVEAEGFADANALLDHLLTPLETDELDPETMALLQVGLDEAECGDAIPLTDDMIRAARDRAYRRFLAGESPSGDVSA